MRGIMSGFSSVAQSCLTLCDPMSVLSPQNFYVEAPAPTVTTFGGRTFKEVTKSKWGHKGGP